MINHSDAKREYSKYFFKSLVMHDGNIESTVISISKRYCIMDNSIRMAHNALTSMERSEVIMDSYRKYMEGLEDE